MTDGSFTGLDDATIVEQLLTTSPDPEGSGGEPGGNASEGPHGAGFTTSLDPAPGEPGIDGSDGGLGATERPDGAGSEGTGLVPEVGESVGPAPQDHSASLLWAGVELRVQLSTLLGHDHYPAELAGWGPVHAELARELAGALGIAQWRFVITDEQGQAIHCGITRARPTGTPTRAARCRAILELQVPETTLHTLAADPALAVPWAGVIADLVRQLTQDHSDQDRDDPTRRTPGAVLRRYLEIRDRYCVMIGCRAPAHHTDADHTHEYSHGGPTTGPNLGGACRHDHRLKGEGGWRLYQPEPGVFRWTSRLGHTYHRHPPKIIEPLLDPILRDQPHYPLTVPPDDGWESDDIWEDPPPEPEPPPEPPPEANPEDDPPPF